MMTDCEICHRFEHNDKHDCRACVFYPCSKSKEPNSLKKKFIVCKECNHSFWLEYDEDNDGEWHCCYCGGIA